MFSSTNDQAECLASCVVPLRASQTGAPLFCIHPSGGDIGIYRKVARHLTPDYPVLGIQSRLLVGATDEFQTIDAMAEHYTKLVVEHQPEGAVRLFGFSFGGFVATAIASLLNRNCLLYTSPSPRDQRGSRMPSSA